MDSLEKKLSRFGSISSRLVDRDSSLLYSRFISDTIEGGTHHVYLPIKLNTRVKAMPGAGGYPADENTTLYTATGFEEEPENSGYFMMQSGLIIPEIVREKLGLTSGEDCEIYNVGPYKTFAVIDGEPFIL